MIVAYTRGTRIGVCVATSRYALLGPVVRQRQSGAIAEEADALADPTDADRTHGGLPHAIGAAQDLGHPRCADRVDRPRMMHVPDRSQSRQTRPPAACPCRQSSA
jgi:hypothetical protein